MLRSDFDNHSLWGVLSNVETQLEAILGEHQPNELPYVERIKTQMAYVRGFDVVASTRSAFFHPTMLANVQTAWDQVYVALTMRTGNGYPYTGYLQQAADHAESGLLQMAAWPRPYGKGGEVRQMNTLFEQLLELQRTSIDALKAEHDALRAEVSGFSTEVEAKRDEVVSQFSTTQTQLTDLESTIEGQKAEVSTSVADAEQAVAALTTSNSEAYEAWKRERESNFTQDFSTLRVQIEEKLESADDEYTELISAKEKYTKLVSAIAADEVASQFESEAAWGRRQGNRYYLVGFALLALASVPLVWLIFGTSRTAAGEIDWTAIITRLGIGVLAGSAATVAIRLGSRLINNANAIKRMELELRAIGPFLANVSEKPKVDDAFVELVSKAFGNTYADTKSTGGKEAADDKDSVTALAQILELVEKARKVVPPSASG